MTGKMKLFTGLLVVGVAMIAGGTWLLLNQTPQTGVPEETSTIEKSMVKVFETGESESPVAFGIVAGDGNQVLTVLDYEEYTPTPDSLEVVTASGDRFSASIQAIDPRTSITLLQIEDADLTAAKTGDSVKIQKGQEVFVQGWHADKEFKKASATITRPGDWPLSFQMWLTEEAMTSGNAVVRQGAAITDGDSNVIGLIGTVYNRLAVKLGGPGMITNCVPVNSALELFDPVTAGRVWAKGPAVISLHGDGRIKPLSQILSSVSSYDEMTEAVQKLMRTLGKPLEAGDELAQGYRHYTIFTSSLPTDGILLTLCYPYLQELRNTDGKLLARAKWVGLQWNRGEGKPDRLFYGVEPYDVEGVYELTGTKYYLEKALMKESDN